MQPRLLRYGLLCLLVVAGGPALADTRRIELPNGDVYEGQVQNEARTGVGTYLWRNGHRYTGEFLDNRMHGQGTYVWPDGRTYTGRFIEDRREGLGTMQWPNGNRYEGEFVDGARAGLGVYHWRDGTVYRGEFATDRMHGYGVKEQPGGNLELQQWAAGELVWSRPLREVPHCRLTISGRPWMFDGDACINGIAHGRGLAVSLDGGAVIPEGRFVLGRLVEGEILALQRGWR
jgi:hypothetical protein